jgi:hypothetical protein
MSLNPRIRVDTVSDLWLDWDPDPQAVVYDITLPAGTHVQAGKSKTTVRLGKPPEPFTVSIAACHAGTYEAATYPPPPPPTSGFDPRTAWHQPPWNLDATQQPLHPNSVSLIRTWNTRGNIRYPNVCTNSYSQAWTIGKATDPHHDIAVTIYGKKTIPRVPIPAGTRPSPDSDHHLVIFDVEQQREIDLWKFDPAAFTAGSGDVWPLGQPLPAGQGSNAAGFPSLALAVWPEEIQAGRIEHALGFSVLKAASSHVYPATKHDGAGDISDLPEGAWLALPGSAFLNPAWPKWVQVVRNALIQHGMFCMDQGGTLGVAGVCPINGGVQWSAVGMGTGGSAGFPADFPWTQMRVLQPPVKP